MRSEAALFISGKSWEVKKTNIAEPTVFFIISTMS